ncbi:hypothetical protein [Nonomuraea sp. B19D2]|uniref:hypothetical protein n=1 Tax=Nonomuraea sp. B19D2 TaxID=3159561 RepID=UPI0032DA8D49
MDMRNTPSDVEPLLSQHDGPARGTGRLYPPPGQENPKPHLSAMDSQQREWVLATALRSLVSREAVEIRNIEELNAVLYGAPEAQVDMHVRVEIDLALTLRRTADRALAIKQQSAVGSAFGYVHIHATDLLLVERITTGGMHLFTLAGNLAGQARGL